MISVGQILATVPIETMMAEIDGRARTASRSDDVLQVLCLSSKYQQGFTPVFTDTYKKAD